MSTELLPDGTYKLDTASELPDVVDMLIVGGGPAGTAAAFRAKELGMTALVVDYDDLMKRIRDYAKDKLILPHFGGGDRMQFPMGGDLVQALHFGPIDKDDMCGTWKSLYRKNNIPAKVGIELTGLNHAPDGTLNVQTWNHRTREEEIFRARHLVLAIGRGVPRRFDIPGNVDGICYKLDDAASYIEGPVCVIGGGTSAAEAVIAISHAKHDAQDDCPVYWSYRGDKMPKVSKALSDVFFDAYLGNGNIRYYPNSEPVAIVTGPDRVDYLSIRIDRKIIDGRSIETTHLEFPKHRCIACIGEDIPEALLGTLGIHMATGGPRNKKRMVVSPLLETRQPNVYLIGDILSQAYLETEDFDADPSTFEEIKHHGNVKAALRDGVFIAEAIRQKLDGKTTIQVDLNFAENEVEAETPAARDTQTFLRAITGSEDASEPATPTPATSSPKPASDVALLVRLNASGVEEDEYPLKKNDTTTIGYGESDIILSDNASDTERHAAINHNEAGYTLSDKGSKAGVFVQLPAGSLMGIQSGELLQLGRHFLLFSIGDASPHFLHYDHTGTLLGRHDLNEGTIVVGRDAPDIILDKDDMVLSRRHLAISTKQGQVQVKDLGSLNKTYLRVKTARHLNPDDVIRVGQHLFRLSIGQKTPAQKTSFYVAPQAAPVSPVPVPPEQPAPASAPIPETSTQKQVAAPADGPSISFEGIDGSFNIGPSQTILNVAQANEIPINYECESGRCGYDPIRIISGAEHLNEMDEDEEGWTLEEVCGLDPKACRLACMTRATGPVKVEIIKK